jgi:Cu/Zn superoxide dismutase
MMRFRLGLLVVLVAVLAGAALLPAAISARTRSLNLDMQAQNSSKQDGTASIARHGSGLRVTITLKNEPAGASEPAHIHGGTCAKLDPVPKVALNPVVDGSSVTDMPAPSSPVQGARAINVHKGTGEDLKVYVSCGDIPTQ